MGSKNNAAEAAKLELIISDAASVSGDGNAASWTVSLGAAAGGAGASGGSFVIGAGSAGAGGAGDCSGFGIGARTEWNINDHGVYDATPFRPAICTQVGHVMIAEQVGVDGEINGLCERCGEMMRGRRMPGGIVVETLEALVDAAMDGAADVEDLAEEILEAEAKLVAERAQLDKAESTLRLAKALLAK